MKNKKNLIIVSMMVIVAVMAIGYSYFATRLNINATGNITSQWNVYFSNIRVGTITGSASNKVTPSVSGTTANMEANLQLPGDSITYELTLTNAGTIGAIIEDIDAKAEGSSAIIYSISGLKIGDKLAGGANKVITIKIEYDANATSQPSETSKTLTVNIDAVQDIGQTIESVTPSISQPISLTSTVMKSNLPSATDDYGTTYYFSGAASDNYVNFGSYTGEFPLYYNPTNGENYMSWSECKIDNDGNDCYNEGETIITTVDLNWRILRVNGNGTVRLIYAGPVAAAGGGADNLGYDEKYVGYTYLNDEGGQTDSTMKASLDSWYQTYLSDYSGYIADTLFCNDRTIKLVEPSYGAITYNGQTSFMCTDKNDRYTVNDTTVGNGYLTYSIGLITAYEVRKAGSYLEELTFGNSMTMTPSFYRTYEGSASGAGLYYFQGSTLMDGDYWVGMGSSSPSISIPVINLNSDVSVTGSGTKTDPYVVQID